MEDTRDGTGLHRGGVSFAGEEQPATAVLRRNAALLQYWSSILAEKVKPQPQLKTRLQVRTFSNAQMGAANGASALNLINEAEGDWSGDVSAYYSPAKQQMTIPGVHLKKGDALFLPVNVPLADQGFCRNCCRRCRRTIALFIPPRN